MFIKTPIDPMGHKLRDTSTEDTLAYASGIVTALTVELNAEKRANRIAQVQILELKAQLARREAELEECIAQTGQPSHQPQHGHTDLKPMSRDEAIKALELNAARNRNLEVEVKALLTRVLALIIVLECLRLTCVCSWIRLACLMCLRLRPNPPASLVVSKHPLANPNQLRRSIPDPLCRKTHQY